MIEAKPGRATEDRGVVRCWHEWEIEGRSRRVILCVETDLELRPDHAGFDGMKLDQLINRVTEMMHGSTAPVDAIRIVPPRSTN